MHEPVILDSGNIILDSGKLEYCGSGVCKPDASELHELIKPQQVKFHSENLKNVLHWQPGSYKDNNTVYFVQYKMYGDKHWFHKQKCWGISSTFCDLTSETCDYSEPYFARVSAARISVQSDWVRTQTFTPRTETNIGPPSALVIPKKKSIKKQVYEVGANKTIRIKKLERSTTY
ncbi:interleukin-22 receptor subunit alpha-2-like, partial [Latimeria chalumnae]|uniref:interleukin-22 receptor subunit alpha-2-like n=1 Tax=Latimeria chalumnae TaxID=7897 RepID=UPI00313AE47C